MFQSFNQNHPRLEKARPRVVGTIGTRGKRRRGCPLELIGNCLWPWVRHPARRAKNGLLREGSVLAVHSRLKLTRPPLPSEHLATARTSNAEGREAMMAPFVYMICWLDRTSPPMISVRPYLSTCGVRHGTMPTPEQPRYRLQQQEACWWFAGAGHRRSA